MSVWTDMAEWVANTPITAYKMNQLRENLNWLKNRPLDFVHQGGVANVTITSTAFISVDPTIYQRTVRTYGGNVLFGVSIPYVIHNTAGGTHMWDVLIDGIEYLSSRSAAAKTYGMMYNAHAAATHVTAVQYVFMIDGLASGEHTFELVVRTLAGTLTLAIETSVWTAQAWAMEVPATS